MNEYNRRYFNVSILAVSIFLAFVVVSPLTTAQRASAISSSSLIEKAAVKLLGQTAVDKVVDKLRSSSEVQKACTVVRDHPNGAKAASALLKIFAIATAFHFISGAIVAHAIGLHAATLTLGTTTAENALDICQSVSSI